jgi:ribosomal-protein-alanine N-acetyltransferase
MNIETERLVLEPVAPADRPAVHEMFTEPGVRRIIFDDVILAPEQTAEIIGKSVSLFEASRFGLWLARTKASMPQSARALVGFGGLWYFRDPPELELLYGVRDAQLKRGYGREIARALVGHAAGTLGMPELRASTHPSHADSRRVLDDLGFRFERHAVVGGLDTVFYTKRL